MLDNEDREMIEKKTGYSLSADEEINNRGKVSAPQPCLI